MECDFIVFGGTGQQGRICSRDLIESGYRIIIAGRDSSKIRHLLKNKRAKFIKVDLRNKKEIADSIKKSRAKVIVNCAELNFNIPVMEAAIETKRPCTDLGGLHDITMKQFMLDNKFKKSNIICITGCGSTPGIVNIMAAHLAEEYKTIDNIMAGFAWDSNLKVFVTPYSIKSIFDEFTEDPVLYKKGKFVKETQMQCKGIRKFREIGRQKIYCIVHSEIYTFARYFKEKGVKYISYMAGFPEHSISKIKALLELGFNSRDPITIKNADIRPRDFTTEVLKRLDPPKGYLEKENLWVAMEGISEGKKKKSEMNCIVKTMKGWEDAGSNINTGRTISIISQMLYKGLIQKTGVHAPEGVVPHKAFFEELEKREMYVYKNGRRLDVKDSD